MSELKIEQQYVLEAKNIIIEYDKVNSVIKDVQSALNSSKNAILEFQSQLEALKFKTAPDKIKEQEMNSLMIDYEAKINKMQSDIKPHLEMLENLKKRSHVLYGILKEKYPGASDEQLKTALNKELEKLKV